MAAAPDLQVLTTTDEALAKKRTRPRPQPIDLDEKGRTMIAQRVLNFFRQDAQARSDEVRRRQHRYAKMMQFEPPQEDGLSNVQLPDILAVSLRMEDQIQNSVIGTRPIINARSTLDVDKDREHRVDLMLDHQFFVEQRGEALIQRLTADFFRDGQFVALTRWITEHRKILYTRNFVAIPFGLDPKKHFEQLLMQAFGKGAFTQLDAEGWDWEVLDEKIELQVRFYTEDEGVIMEVQGEPLVFEGPCSVRYGWEDVLAPAWSENLQPPGPSNPGGAPHVLLVDYPTRDEIIRGIEEGYYDLISEKDVKGIETFRDWTDGDRELARQRHEMRGQGPVPIAGANDDPDHRQIRRLLCFDTWRGLDVVFWVLAGPDLLLRARPLTEYCPGLRPTRPIAHAVCIDIQDTWIGMGIPELMESTHDFQVATFNYMTDAAAHEMQPFFFYATSSNLKPEEIRLVPGKGIPLRNPQADINIRQFQPQATQVGTNLIALSRQDQEKLTLVGELQVGQIPTGKSAALRTSGGIQQVLAQGEARPERILRRFFGGLCQLYGHMYQLDRHFLSDEKKFRATGSTRPEEDPIVSIRRAQDLGDVHFEFGANVLNSSKVALQQALEQMLNMMGTPLFLQMGITQPDGFYRLAMDYFKALGQNPEKYANKPPDADNPPIYAGQALAALVAGQMPQGRPAEGSFEAHTQALVTLLKSPDNTGVAFMDHLSPDERERVGHYILELQQRAMQMQQQMQLMQAAQASQLSQGQPGRPPGAGQPPPAGPSMVSGGAEQINESLPMGTGTPQ